MTAAAEGDNINVYNDCFVVKNSEREGVLVAGLGKNQTFQANENDTTTDCYSLSLAIWGLIRTVYLITLTMFMISTVTYFGGVITSTAKVLVSCSDMNFDTDLR